MTTKAGTPILAKKKPCTAPMAAPAAIATITASHSFMPWVTLSTATIAPRDTADRADRQVDLAEQQHEDDADGHHAGADDRRRRCR